MMNRLLSLLAHEIPRIFGIRYVICHCIVLSSWFLLIRWLRFCQTINKSGHEEIPIHKNGLADGVIIFWWYINDCVSSGNE